MCGEFDVEYTHAAHHHLCFVTFWSLYCVLRKNSGRELVWNTGQSVMFLIGKENELSYFFLSMETFLVLEVTEESWSSEE